MRGQPHPRRSPLRAAAWALVVPLLIACESQPDVPDTEERRAAPPAGIATARERWVAGWNDDDAGVVTMAYVGDGSATIGDTTYTGRAEIERWVRDNLFVVSDLRLTPVTTQSANGDWHEAGTYTHLTTPPDVEPFMAEGRYTITWTPDAVGDWWIRSTDIQPNPPPES